MTATQGARGPTDVEPISDEFRATVATILAEFIDAKQHELSPLGADLDPLFTTARTYVEGGKRLRPAFAYWGFRAAGGSPSKSGAMIKAAAAIELVHASALVHDDVMDDSRTRRGGPAAHRQLAGSRERRAPGTPMPFGTMAAILLGDLLLSWSDELLADSGLKPKPLGRARAYFDKLRTEVVAGQYLDALAQTRIDSSSADAMRVVRYKSAKYTVERPLQFGAAVAKADRLLLVALSAYGLPLGEAFQLRDDILGVFGDESVTGKPSGDDIREGKRTLLVARAYANASLAQRRILDENLATPDITPAGVAAVQQVMRDTGALTAVETVITELTAASLSALRHASVGDAEAVTALRVLTERATDRTR